MHINRGMTAGRGLLNDYATGFRNLLDPPSASENYSGAAALAKMALGCAVPSV